MVIDELAEYAVHERDRGLPPDVLHHAKRAVIDWCAATAPGSLQMPTTGLLQAVTEDLGRGFARIFPSGETATIRGATIIYAAAVAMGDACWALEKLSAIRNLSMANLPRFRRSA